MLLYHGASHEFSIDKNRGLYVSPELSVAKEFALGLTDLGDYNEESFIYAIDINVDTAVEIDDFDFFDSMGYNDYDNMPEIAFNKESGWYWIRHPEGLYLLDHYKNEL